MTCEHQLPRKRGRKPRDETREEESAVRWRKGDLSVEAREAGVLAWEQPDMEEGQTAALGLMRALAARALHDRPRDLLLPLGFPRLGGPFVALRFPERPHGAVVDFRNDMFETKIASTEFPDFW